MYKETVDDINRLQGKAKKKKKVTTVDFEVLDRMGKTSAGIDGSLLIQLISDKESKYKVNGCFGKIVKDALETLPKIQRKYIELYFFNEEVLGFRDIAKNLGRTPSTICRTIHRGLFNMMYFIKAKLIIERCIDDNGKFNYILFLNSTNLVEDRQKEIMFLRLVKGITLQKIADFCGVNKSTISRDLTRAVKHLKQVGVEFDPSLSSFLFPSNYLETISEKEFVEKLGLSKYFYYDQVLANVYIDGIRMSDYAICKMMSKGITNASIVKELGCVEQTVDRVYREYFLRKTKQRPSTFIDIDAEYPYNPDCSFEKLRINNLYKVASRNILTEYNRDIYNKIKLNINRGYEKFKSIV